MKIEIPILVNSGVRDEESNVEIENTDEHIGYVKISNNSGSEFFIEVDVLMSALRALRQPTLASSEDK